MNKVKAIATTLNKGLKLEDKMELVTAFCLAAGYKDRVYPVVGNEDYLEEEWDLSGKDLLNRRTRQKATYFNYNGWTRNELQLMGNSEAQKVFDGYADLMAKQISSGDFRGTKAAQQVLGDAVA